uniref:tRNA-binding domain-containing protein n=1 Tax=Amphora coffeiformis TaxID=265554 RepID=A0A7S3L7D2_9STRA|mmetsp:Transcript_9465/g.18115  ORF Transcript_9465/g.18115 Transcript_9465/m.18115 type:complete len:427 (+) Transcript_9465:102-1382(+)|eukprot:scaffold1690_cov182-Amphora_coffeaeformis.AAC.69
MGVPTNAATAKLTVSKAAFEKDKLLQWVCHLASPFQLQVAVQPKAAALQLEAQNVTVTMRNTILRTLCGMGLHHALDQAPYYLMGGGTTGPLAMGQLVQWMSLADSLRTKAEPIEDVLNELEENLGQQSFLIGSAQPSLADFDVALVLADSSSADVDLSAYPNVARWRETVLWAFQATAPPSIQAPAVAVTAFDPPVFYNGTEDMEAILQPTKKEAPKKGSAAKPQEKAKPQDGKKQEKQAKAAAGGGGNKPATANQAPDSYDISALDIRVGKIVKAWEHEGSDKLFCEDVDLGTETRQIASGLRAFYKTADLQDRHVLVLCNLKKRSLAGFPSHGMVLCASNADHTAVEFVVPPEGSKLGERVQFEGYTGEPEPENKIAKKKVFEKLAPDLKTDDKGNVVWKTVMAKTEAGVVRALNGMPNATVA